MPFILFMHGTLGCSSSFTTACWVRPETPNLIFKALLMESEVPR